MIWLIRLKIKVCFKFDQNVFKIKNLFFSGMQEVLRRMQKFGAKDLNMQVDLYESMLQREDGCDDQNKKIDISNKHDASIPKMKQ